MTKKQMFLALVVGLILGVLLVVFLSSQTHSADGWAGNPPGTDTSSSLLSTASVRDLVLQEAINKKRDDS